MDEFYWIIELSIVGGEGKLLLSVTLGGGRGLIFQDSSYLDLESESQISPPCDQATEPDRALSPPMPEHKNQSPALQNVWGWAVGFPTPTYWQFEGKTEYCEVVFDHVF